jgi:hypothetical protein
MNPRYLNFRIQLEDFLVAYCAICQSSIGRTLVTSVVATRNSIKKEESFTGVSVATRPLSG